MKLSKKSWHAWVYKMTYGWYDLPTNLCPYFWKVMVGILVSLFFLPFHAASYTFMFIRGDRYYHDGYFNRDNISYSIFINIACCCLLGIGGMFFVSWSDLNFFNFFGVLGVVIIFGILIAWMKLKWRDWFPRKKKEYVVEVPKEKSPNILIEFVKAKYNRYCPKIDWKK